MLIAGTVARDSSALFWGLPGFNGQSYMVNRIGLKAASGTEIVLTKPNFDGEARIIGTGLTFETRATAAGQSTILTGGTITAIEVSYNFTRVAVHAAQFGPNPRPNGEYLALMAQFARASALETAGRMTFPDGLAASALGIAMEAAANLGQPQPMAQLLDSFDLSLSGSGLANGLSGGSGNDVLDGRGGPDSLFGGLGADTLKGSKGNDQLWGEQGGDLLNGGNGRDTLNGDNGADTLKGGKGNDTLQGGAGSDRLEGEAGADTLSGSTGNDRLIGGSGKDVLSGDEGADTLEGGRKSDSLFGGDGPDLLTGGLGNDTLSGEGATGLNPGDDTLVGGAGRDLIFGDAGADVLRGDAGADTINGGSESDTLKGGSGNDQLFGQGGDDFIFAGAGADVLVGGGGTNALTGGPGPDLFAGDGDFFQLGGVQQIADFQDGIDKIGYHTDPSYGLVGVFLSQVGADAQVLVQYNTANLWFVLEGVDSQLIDSTDVQFL